MKHIIPDAVVVAFAAGLRESIPDCRGSGPWGAMNFVWHDVRNKVMNQLEKTVQGFDREEFIRATEPDFRSGITTSPPKKFKATQNRKLP